MSAIDTRPLAVALMGPTASGKTALACVLAERFPLELISVDSALVYRGLDIGSAKPDAATLARYPHRLIDIREPHEPYSAGEFRSDALREMGSITAQGRIPLLVGGTGLYFRALMRGFSELPASDPARRAQLQADLARDGLAALHARLAAADPVSAARIRASDTQRVLRALEVIALGGRPLSEQQQGREQRPPYRLLRLALVPDDRGPLHARIAERFDAMLAGGLIEEVQALRARAGIHPHLPAMRAVGYRQVWQYLDGEFSGDELRDRGVFATRQLAKRQITMLRAELDARWLDPERAGLAETAASALNLFLDGARPTRVS
ncbi:MAG TPA: tRNA (adenosine(37)-N6)-dimethylallyltransferase MiaA [Tahibacter sp.]|uniref:tRNA (adenosine(37)-N6)-dimethylallyltransferase MiaA n=1 Tax=Tahibacter sp. TaxID=2056211 RepID=UPI002C6D3F5B|nr:tRNA (adenosine(37)-N6)-dimethylallyltransferase MiaA [Tahibacter sp.]HSX62637.1 tRNA (adenosine(37)-N6)-dimethylallyltransferase MiaA [Tahibacter sp.]